jgi:hypothetical protein
MFILPGFLVAREALEHGYLLVCGQMNKGKHWFLNKLLNIQKTNYHLFLNFSLTLSILFGKLV